MKKAFFIVFLGISTFGYSQQQEYRMKIRVTKDGTGERFELRVDKKAQEACFYYAQYDSTSSNWAARDRKLYNKLIRDYYKNGVMPAEHGRIIEGINRSYEYYTNDSIIVPLQHPFIRTTDSVANATSEELRRFEENKEFQTITGYQVTLDIFSEDKLRTINVRNPTLNSHPLIYNLITGMLLMYRESNPKILVTKESTFGY